jgi:quercetin dioxygenase-like cupin family protein
MPTKGQLISIPTTGDTYEFLETAADSKGERVSMKATIRNRGPLVPRHFHVLQDETFEVISGRLTVLVDDQTKTLSAGESITLPKTIPHNHYNDEVEPVTYIHSVTPALDFEYLIENLAGLAADGKGKNGKYGLLQELVSLRYLDSKSYLADVPVGLQNLMMKTIAPIARLFGYRAVYAKYSGMEK